MANPIDTDAIRSMIGDRSDNLYDAEIQRSALCDEVDRLRAIESAVLASSLTTHHGAWCEWVRSGLRGSNRRSPCSCGLDAVLAALDGDR